MSRIKVVQNPDKPVSKETLAEAIVSIGAASESLRQSGLNEDAIITLLAHKTKVGRGDIATILKGMRQLRAWYCRG